MSPSTEPAASTLLRRITDIMLAEYVSLNEKRQALSREARTIGDKLGIIEEQVEQALKAAGKTKLERSDYVAQLKNANGTVSWKKEFVRLAGDEAATALQAAAPKKTEVTICRKE
jgi:hypothetical protein